MISKGSCTRQRMRGWTGREPSRRVSHSCERHRKLRRARQHGLFRLVRMSPIAQLWIFWLTQSNSPNSRRPGRMVPRHPLQYQPRHLLHPPTRQRQPAPTQRLTSEPPSRLGGFQGHRRRGQHLHQRVRPQVPRRQRMELLPPTRRRCALRRRQTRQYRRSLCHHEGVSSEKDTGYGVQWWDEFGGPLCGYEGRRVCGFQSHG
jgi:hypothetical protein